MSETGWLIERADAKPRILYFTLEPYTREGTTAHGWSWTSDHLQATRFGRKRDAELAWQVVTTRPPSEVEIIEHAWDDGAKAKASPHGGMTLSDAESAVVAEVRRIYGATTFPPDDAPATDIDVCEVRTMLKAIDRLTAPDVSAAKVEGGEKP